MTTALRTADLGPEKGSREVPTGAEQYPGPGGDNPRGEPEKKGDRSCGRARA